VDRLTSEISSSASSTRVLLCPLPAGLGEADAPHAPHTPLTSDKAPATPNAATPRRLVVCEDRFLSPGMRVSIDL
jgi:hypothetical protein